MESINNTSNIPISVTGLITAAGGCWNASIIAEYVTFGGKTVTTIGLGALITESTANGNYAMLLASTLAMIIMVVVLNKLVWNRLYRLAEEKFRIEL